MFMLWKYLNPVAVVFIESCRWVKLNKYSQRAKEQAIIHIFLANLLYDMP